MEKGSNEDPRDEPLQEKQAEKHGMNQFGHTISEHNYQLLLHKLYTIAS